ncbi:type 1 glutamine amidotransferase domain-containing protein [Celerinatantimonas sp. MCCC 1A17872]|uniref:type 1 glutamine amidotransferase domain-containing protein n=1 Tax=Celerinatantimonas sp. MCCC 1A17872 TaxID=3177514 RepID=UPI0038C69096
MRNLLKVVVAAVAVFLVSQSAFAADKVLMVVSSHQKLGTTNEATGFWLSELTHPYFVVKKAGLDITIASIKGGEAPIDPRSLANMDKDTKAFLGNPNTRKLIDRTPALASLKVGQFKAIVFVGGHGAMWDFPSNKAANRLAVGIYQRGGIVAAVCHGPAALTTLTLPNGKKLIAGKKVTGFSNAEESAMKLTNVVPFSLEDKLKAAGATYESGPMWKSEVVVDGRVITGQNPSSAHDLGVAVAKALGH